MVIVLFTPLPSLRNDSSSRDFIQQGLVRFIYRLIHTPAKFTEWHQGLVRFVYRLIHTPAKFTEWLIQQGLVRFVYCLIHTPAKFTEWLTSRD